MSYAILGAEVYVLLTWIVALCALTSQGIDHANQRPVRGMVAHFGLNLTVVIAMALIPVAFASRLVRP